MKPHEQAVTCDPDITTFKRTKDDKYIILACDGIWDCLSNEDSIVKMDQYINKIKPN